MYKLRLVEAAEVLANEKCVDSNYTTKGNDTLTIDNYLFTICPTWTFLFFSFFNCLLPSLNVCLYFTNWWVVLLLSEASKLSVCKIYVGCQRLNSTSEPIWLCAQPTSLDEDEPKRQQTPVLKLRHLAPSPRAHLSISSPMVRILLSSITYLQCTSCDMEKWTCRFF